MLAQVDSQSKGLLLLMSDAISLYRRGVRDSEMWRKCRNSSRLLSDHVSYSCVISKATCRASVLLRSRCNGCAGNRFSSVLAEN